jgi:hypothetical protein
MEWECAFRLTCAELGKDPSLHKTTATDPCQRPRDPENGDPTKYPAIAPTYPQPSCLLYTCTYEVRTKKIHYDSFQSIVAHTYFV